MDILDLVEKGKIKRIFRARAKISYPGACCHITQRAPGKEMLFLEEADYLSMLHLIKEKSREFDFEVFTLSLMLNHLHLQIRLGKANLPESMKSLFENYARLFNRKYERKGHVFCGAYRQALCLDNSYLLATSVYIHLNAVRAGLVKWPWDYRWSSCRLYSEPIDRKTFVNYEFILRLLSEDIQEARRIYRELLVQAMEIKTTEVWEQPDVLDSFKVKLFRSIPSLTKLRKKILTEESDILGEMELEEKIEELGKKQRLRSPQDLRARKYLIEQLRSRGFTVAQIAERLNVSRQSIHNTLNLTK